MSDTVVTAVDALHHLCLADPVWAERYEGWTELGRGGSASVVRTFSRATGEDIALKVFHHLLSEDEQRFRQEVRNAQRLTSPHIVRTYGAFPRGRLAWIEMELVPGPDLRHELDRRAQASAPFDTVKALPSGSRSLRPWWPRTMRASSTATSSPETSCCRSRGRRSRSSATSGSRASRARRA